MKSDVFSKMKLKLSISFMLILALVLALLIGFLNFYLYLSNTKESDAFMTTLILNDGLEHERGRYKSPLSPINEHYHEKDAPYNGKGRYRGEYTPDIHSQKNDAPLFSFMVPSYRVIGFRNVFTAKLDREGNIKNVIHDFSNNVSDDFKSNLVRNIIETGKTKGLYSTFGYMLCNKDDGILIVILDREFELRQQKRFLLVSLVLFLVSLLVVFFISSILSNWSIRPVQLAFSQQKRFIADASHELKTPIAVIDANIDVLLQEYPNNKWLSYIKTENARMGNLVLDMLTLAKNDAGRTVLNMIPFDFAKAAALAVLPFESVAFEQKKKLILDGISQEPVMVMGDESKIKQLVIILTDNALKNSDENAIIKISVKKENNKCVLRVYNTGAGIPQEYIDKIFNRFYRVDSSRARNTGGYGLGLSIAKTIADAHKGKITVNSEVQKYAEFVYTMPLITRDKKK